MVLDDFWVKIWAGSEWFDREIEENLSIKDKLFKKFKSSRLNMGWEINKEQEMTSKEQSNRRKSSIFRRNFEKI